MQNDLNETLSVVQEIRQLTFTLETVLKRPQEGHTSDNAQHLIQETDPIFENIIKKTLTAKETLGRQLTSHWNPSARLDCQVSSASSNVEPNSVPNTPLPVMSLILPSPSSADMPQQSRYETLPPSTYPAKPPADMEMKNSSSTGLPSVGGRDTRHLEMDNRKGIRTTINYVKPDRMEQISHQTHQRRFPGLTPVRSMVISPSGLADFGQTNFQDILQGCMQQQTQSHLIRWLEKQFCSDYGFNTEFNRLMEFTAESLSSTFRVLPQMANMLESDNLTTIDILSEVDKELERVIKTECLPVRGIGPDTVMCLDTSASMGGENFKKLLTVVKKIIDGVEELAKYEELQENIAVTTFGSNPRVVTHLTNDYTHVREQIQSLHPEGPSPLYRGLAMAIAACIGNYSEVNINDVRLMPRVILVTDGKFSEHHRQTGQDMFDSMNAIVVPVAGQLMKMAGFACYCVKIGIEEESEMVKKLTKSLHGKIYHHEQIDELAKMSKYLFASTRLLRQFPDLADGDEEARKNDEVTLNAIFELEIEAREGSILQEFSKLEQETVIKLAINISQRQWTKVAEQNEYRVEELPDLQLPPLGTRVRRGPDWKETDDQDSNGPGTVVNHKSNRTVDVLWDCRVMPCNYNCNDPCEVLPTDTDERIVEEGELIQVGCRVIRADGWNQGDEDGGPGACGVVCMCTKKGNVTVRWHDGTIGKYRYGEEVKFLDSTDELAEASGYDDTKIASDAKFNPEKKIKFTSSKFDTNDSNSQFLKTNINDFSSEIKVNTPLEEMSKEHPDSREPFVWSFQQEGRDTWTQFDSYNNRKLESEWSRRKTSVVTINGILCRVVFAKMAMTYTPVNQEKTPVTAKVKREERLETCDDEQMPEESIKQERKEADIQSSAE